MRYRFLVLFALALLAFAAKKKKAEEITQVLELPKDPPQVAIAETRRLMFHVSPLSGKGLLTQQTRDALRAVLKASGNLPMVHVRAFVAGSGDIRRIPQIVSEVFTDKKLPLPSVSVVLAGGLPLENAQVAIETISVAKRDVITGGLDFVAGEPAVSNDLAAPPAPLLNQALDHLAAQVNPGQVLRASCFISTLANFSDLTSAITARFPGAVANLVQTQRSPWQASAQCEAIARGTRITAEKLAFSGTRVAFGEQEKDAKLAFQRLDRDLTEAGAGPANIVLTNLYPLSRQMAEMARRLRPATAPMAIILFEGLAAVEGGFAVDAIATVSR